MAFVDDIFVNAEQQGASDVHIAVASPIMFRVDGELVPASDGVLQLQDAVQIMQEVLGEERYNIFVAEKEMDSSYSVGENVRLRVNCHFEKGNPSLVARLVPQDIPSMDEAGLRGSAIEGFCKYLEGLILFTGPTGSGKSTSMAAMLDTIRMQRTANIITLEDPIEFIFPPEAESNSMVRQRQFGEDFLEFSEAMKRVLRQDPDIVMVGEMRDLETIAAALTLAETGHLVLGTLHTPNAMQTIDRIIDVFPPHQQSQIRSQLSLSLKAIVAQRLLPGAAGGRVPIREILVNTPAVSNVIRDNRAHELASVMQMSGEEGMISFEADAKRLYKQGLIDDEGYELAMTLVNTIGGDE